MYRWRVVHWMHFEDPPTRGKCNTGIIIAMVALGRESLVAVARRRRQRISRSIGPLSFHISPMVFPLDFGRTCERVRRALLETMYDSFHGSLAKTAARVRLVALRWACRKGERKRMPSSPRAFRASYGHTCCRSQSQLYPGVRRVRPIYTPYQPARGFGRVTWLDGLECVKTCSTTYSNTQVCTYARPKVVSTAASVCKLSIRRRQTRTFFLLQPRKSLCCALRIFYFTGSVSCHAKSTKI